MDIEKQVYSECFNPQKVKIYNNIKHVDEFIEVPCGKCYHCLITRVNEWVTRMTANSLNCKNTYFITLTYDSSLFGTKFFSETDPVIHSFNELHKKMPAPLRLEKTHLQKFFKRLRKNTGKKFQYFACGEYGDTWSRPHYHFILWSNNSFTPDEIQFSWSIEENNVRYKIGNVDFVDMNKDAINLEHPYKYVCKYLQKRDFDFNNLKTNKYHYGNFKRNYEGITLKGADAWRQYQKMFAPFFLCSKRPAIGYAYFEENKARFQQQDFRLFNLPSNSVFPQYFYRKTRETLCPYKTISPVSLKPNSFASIPQVVSLLRELQDCINYDEGMYADSLHYEYVIIDNYQWRRNDPDGADKLPDGKNKRQFVVRFYAPSISDHVIVLPVNKLNFYDCKNKYRYSLASDFIYNVCDSYNNVIYRVPIDEVLKEVSSSYYDLYERFLRPNQLINDTKKREKMQVILDKYGTYDDYLTEKKACTQTILNNFELRQKTYKLTKNKF